MADTPIVLIHGIPSSARVWDGVRADLERDFEVIAPDLLGFGAAEVEPGADAVWADAQARALADLLEARGIERATLVGHDYGGPVALSLAALRPDLPERMVLCATNAFPDVPIPLPISAVTWPLVGGLAARLLFSTPSLRMMVRRGFVSEPPELDDAVWFGDERRRRTVRTIFATALRELEERYAPIERSLRSLPCPALVVWSSRDDFFDLDQGRRTADALPDGRLVVYDDCGHFVPAEQARRLAADIRSFVREPIPA